MCYSAEMLPYSLLSLSPGEDAETVRRLLHRYLSLALTGISRPLPAGPEAQFDA